MEPTGVRTPMDKRNLGRSQLGRQRLDGHPQHGVGVVVSSHEYFWIKSGLPTKTFLET